MEGIPGCEAWSVPSLPDQAKGGKGSGRQRADSPHPERSRNQAARKSVPLSVTITTP
ncbi:hypothetical protein USDA257_c05000 [Sinorhizobium fredii USDA 257]|uniref:Uncharacterized protein n=1 Tax=Sinorhizobium fredii (strain USDA 257) TaxID=1185652 RepID=I3WZP0_SINF2|nr:hypothetical protein USDA257_c05000 [Sinorhizobium fredii USDA 257]